MREFSFLDNDWEMYEFIHGEKPVKMLVDEEFDDHWCGMARRPYFQLRGRPVTPEQAMEILIRTESLWDWNFDSEKTLPCFVPSALCRNSYYTIAFDWRTGWVHPDGTIGQNNMFGFKYAEIHEIIRDLVPIVSAFPYLDYFIGVSYMDEHLPEREDCQKNKFAASIQYGIWVHDKTIEIVNGSAARKLYTKYEKLYEVPNKAIYETDYYTDQEPLTLDWKYFKQAIELVNMPNSEDFLRKYASRLSDIKWQGKVLTSKSKFESGGN